METGDQVARLLHVILLSWTGEEADRQAQAIGHGMQLGGISAF